MDKPFCETCVYYAHACCHRNPPTLIPAPEESASTFWSVWPEVDPDDWCGEHPDFPAYVASQSTCKPPDESAS
jgi:hypothetical protein